jgi:6-phosphogluconate dehydrogenase (decarboxylating)
MGVGMNGTAMPDIKKIGIIGTGVMGSMMSLLLAEHGVDVSIYDRSEASMQNAAAKADKAGLGDKIHVCKDIEALCQSLDSRKVFLFSLPHGGPVRTLTPYLTKGDIVIDGSNENYTVTQKRQGWLQSRGVSYIGMGVSGGFSGARHGPSLMPGGDEPALDLLIPLLKKIAAKDDQGRPCVAKIGSGGSGHYVKMIHNGIEHGIMSALCEAWGLMDNCLDMTGDEIGAVFDKWNNEGELVSGHRFSISVINLFYRETTSSSPSAGLSAGRRVRTARATSSTRSETPLCRMPMIPKAQEFGPTSKQCLPTSLRHHCQRHTIYDLHRPITLYGMLSTVLSGR